MPELPSKQVIPYTTVTILTKAELQTLTLYAAGYMCLIDAHKHNNKCSQGNDMTGD